MVIIWVISHKGSIFYIPLSELTYLTILKGSHQKHRNWQLYLCSIEKNGLLTSWMSRANYKQLNIIYDVPKKLKSNDISISQNKGATIKRFLDFAVQRSYRQTLGSISLSIQAIVKPYLDFTKSRIDISPAEDSSILLLLAAYSPVKNRRRHDT